MAFKATDGPVDDIETYDFHLDNVEIRDFFPIDIGAKNVITPATNGCSGINETITIGVKNYGTNTLNFSITPMTLNVSISGASTQSFSTVISSGILLPDSIFNAVSTAIANFSAVGTHIINATATLSGDGNNGNNSFAIPTSFIVTTVSNFPYTESFETIVSGWSIQQISGTGLWTYLNGTGNNPALSANSGTKMAYFNSYANGFSNAVSRLSSTCLNFTNLNSPKLEFYLSQDNAYPYNKDSLIVVVSTDGGSTWSSSILALSRYNQTYATPGWKKFSVCLDQYAGMSGIKIGFIAKSAFGSNMYIDDVNISETTQPVSGFISSSANLLCGGMNTFLNLYSYSGSIQWQQSLDDISYTNITGANLDTLTSPDLWSTTFFRVITSFNNVCIVTDSSTSIQVDVLPAPQIDLGPDAIICASSYVLNAGVQDPGTTFEWSNGSTNQTLTVTTSGQYYVVGTSSFFCQTADTINITLKTPVIVNAGIDQTICEGSNALLSASGSGTSYLWNTGATSSAINVTPALTSMYLVTVSGSNGCVAKDSLKVTVNSSSFVNLGPDISQCASTVTVNAGNSSNTYLWNTGATTPSINITNSGVYFVKATIIGGCIAYDTISVALNPAITVNLGQDITQCGGNVSLNAGNVGSTYSWNTGATSQNITTFAGGTYYVTVTSFAGSTVSDTILVNIKPMPVVNLGPDVFGCTPNITLSTSSTGSYLWSTGATTQNILVSNAGTYSLTVNLNGCISKDTVIVSLSSAPTVNLGLDLSSCSSSVLLNAGNSGSTYLWNTGVTAQTIEATTSGNYSVEVTSPGGCIGSDVITVTILPSVSANAGADITVCPGSTIQLSASGGLTYLWNNSTTGQSISIVPVSSSTYTVSVSDANGCTGTDEVNVIVGTPPTADFTAIANGGTILITNNSINSSAYVWDFGDGAALDVSTTPSHTYLTTGMYTIKLVAVNGCGMDTAFQTLNLTVGIEEEEFANAVTVYPVPSAGIIKVHIKSENAENVSIKIISPEGRIVGEKVIERYSSGLATFDLTNLPSGYYFVQVINDKMVINKKIILQR
jgi:hypothetical protein